MRRRRRSETPHRSLMVLGWAPRSKNTSQREGTCRGTVKSLERVVIDWDDGTLCGLLAERGVADAGGGSSHRTVEGDHPRGGRRKRGPRGGRRRRRSWGEVGARRAGRSASRNWWTGARPTRPSRLLRIQLPTKTCPACATRACTRGSQVRLRPRVWWKDRAGTAAACDLRITTSGGEGDHFIDRTRAH